MSANANEEELVQAIRRKVTEKYGFEPNLLPKLLASPQVTQVYLHGFGFLEASSLSPVDIQAAALAVSVFNACGYCSGAHGAMCLKAGVSAPDVLLIRAGKSPDDPRLAAVTGVVRRLLETRGLLGPEDLADYEKMGISRRQIHELIAIVALKTITNYVNHIEPTRLNEEFLRVMEQAGIATG